MEALEYIRAEDASGSDRTDDFSYRFELLGDEDPRR